MLEHVDALISNVEKLKLLDSMLGESQINAVKKKVLRKEILSVLIANEQIVCDLSSRLE